MAGALAAFNFVSSLANGFLQQDAYKAQSIIDDANTDAANTVRAGNNQFYAAQAAYSAMARSIGNNQKLEAAGDALDAATTNTLRVQDATVTGSLTERLQASEQLGAMRAAAASNGVGGASAQMLQSTLQAASDRQVQQTQQSSKYQTYDLLLQRRGLAGNMVRSLDFSPSIANIDYGTTVAPFRAESLAASNPLLGALLSTGSNAASRTDAANFFS